MDGGERFSREQNWRAVGSPQNPSHFYFLLRLRLHPSERASEAAGVVTGRRSDTVARLLTDGRRSPEGERAIIEQPCCDALIREPEPVNPRVDAGEPWVPFPDSDEVRSGNGMAQVSPEPLFLMLGFLRFGDSLFLFQSDSY
jgi:hypothetical protein